MKYAIVILSGAADEPSEYLEGKTPIESAPTPTLDTLCAIGKQGAVRLAFRGEEPGVACGLLRLCGVPEGEDIGPDEAYAAGIDDRAALPEHARFTERYGLSGCVVGGEPSALGAAMTQGFVRLPVPGLSAGAECDLGAMGSYAAEALDRHDVVVVHVPACDALGLAGDVVGKRDALASIDERVLGPIFERLRTFGDIESDGSARGWRMLVCVDHAALSEERARAAGMTPFVMAGAWIRTLLEDPFGERAAGESDLQVEPGTMLMEFFLFSGLLRGRPGR